MILAERRGGQAASEPIGANTTSVRTDCAWHRNVQLLRRMPAQVLGGTRLTDPVTPP
jgi:hypothetical protein